MNIIIHYVEQDAFSLWLFFGSITDPGSWVSSVCATTWNSICLVFFALFPNFRVNCGSLSSLRCCGYSWRGQGHLITITTSVLEDQNRFV